MDQRDMPTGVHETLWQLFRNGPTWDGDLVSKEARTWMVSADLAGRAAGFNFLTAQGVEMAVSLEMDRRKEKELRR